MNKEGVSPLLRVEGLRVSFGIGSDTVHAVDGISFDVKRGEVFSLVGESGCGKTTAGRAIIGLYRLSGGNIYFDGELIASAERGFKRRMVSDIQMVFQDPMASLDPRMTVMEIIAEGLVIKREGTRREIEERVYRMLELVGLTREHAGRYPHEFSGGQRQRIGIARALIMNPKLIIADECISALDVSIQAQVVNLMRDIQKETGAAYLFIAHDLSMVKYISDRIGVLHLGHLVETGTTEEIFANPVHPYTRSLISAIPHPNPAIERTRTSIHYDYFTSGIDYLAGELRTIEGTHKVLATEEEFEKWTKAEKNYR